ERLCTLSNVSKSTMRTVRQSAKTAISCVPLALLRRHTDRFQGDYRRQHLAEAGRGYVAG
ncbi:hypothetical protein, partial [Bradyrhizobium yuanmingense]|uniref:hypothetical protein n=1 Tax=Bradyrhizobium yuanmingense TaxID=108015 RepID=UPI001AEC4478